MMNSCMKLVSFAKVLKFNYGLFRRFDNSRLTSIKKGVHLQQGRKVPLGKNILGYLERDI